MGRISLAGATAAARQYEAGTVGAALVLTLVPVPVGSTACVACVGRTMQAEVAALLAA